jgi:hypothetical protein
LSAFAASSDSIEPSVNSKTVITPWSDYVTVSIGHYVKTSGIGVRANSSIRLDFTILSATYDEHNTNLRVYLTKASDDTVVQSLSYHDVGSYSYTFTVSDGGSYYIEFGSRGSKYRINYTVTF